MREAIHKLSDYMPMYEVRRFHWREGSGYVLRGVYRLLDAAIAVDLVAQTKLFVRVWSARECTITSKHHLQPHTWVPTEDGRWMCTRYDYVFIDAHGLGGIIGDAVDVATGGGKRDPLHLGLPTFPFEAALGD